VVVLNGNRVLEHQTYVFVLEEGLLKLLRELDPFHLELEVVLHWEE
jgi:hypothetical protein